MVRKAIIIILQAFSYCGYECIRSKRFLYNRAEFSNVVGHYIRHVIPRHKNHINVRMQREQLLRHFDTTHYRHGDVAQY